MYLNGNYNGAATWGDEAAGAPASSQDWYLGWNPFESNHYYDGNMDHFTIWDYALSESEIQAIMDTELNLDETGVVGYWKFNAGEGEILYDHTGNANHGTIHGATWSDDIP